MSQKIIVCNSIASTDNCLILSLETSTNVCLVTLHTSGQLLGKIYLHQKKSHSESIMGMIDYLLLLNKCKKNDLSAIAVSRGPGSYTGLRIGTSIAKGLCYALGKPLISVSTLKAMAYSMRHYTTKLLCPMIDALKMYVYCLVADSNGNIIESISQKVIDATSYADLLTTNRMIFFGNGAAKCIPYLSINKNATFITTTEQNTSIGELAYEKFKKNQFEDIVLFEPDYLQIPKYNSIS